MKSTLICLAVALAAIAYIKWPRLRDGVPARIVIPRDSVRWGAIVKGLENYRWSMGNYPATHEGLAHLFKKPSEVGDKRFTGPYLPGDFEELADPWGNPFGYRCPGRFNVDSYDLWSRGPNGKDEGGIAGSDDIKNWSEK